MQKVDTALQSAGIKEEARLLLQVHDELIFEVKEDKKLVEQVASIVAKAMSEAHDGTRGDDVPLLVDVKVGTRWGSLSSLGTR
jgi:DNA polymerase-1